LKDQNYSKSKFSKCSYLNGFALNAFEWLSIISLLWHSNFCYNQQKLNFGTIIFCLLKCTFFHLFFHCELLGLAWIPAWPSSAHAQSHALTRTTILDTWLCSPKWQVLFLCFRSEEESEFREFLETVAVVLCSDIEITPDIFHRAARGYGVS